LINGSMWPVVSARCASGRPYSVALDAIAHADAVFDLRLIGVAHQA
jgi:hypothetical protein